MLPIDLAVPYESGSVGAGRERRHGKGVKFGHKDERVRFRKGLLYTPCQR